jgi:hypothetical protein
MNTCGTCNHFGEVYELELWDRETETDVTSSKFHICDLLKHINGGEFAPSVVIAQSAGVIDGSGYHAAFCVSEEFGCNKWEPRS